MENFELVVGEPPRPPVGGTKRCPFCGCWHSKPDPAVYCCPDHARRTQRQNAWITRRAKHTARRHLAERAVAAHWRDVIFGRKEPSLPRSATPDVGKPDRRRAGKPHPPPGALEAAPPPPDAL